MEEQSAAQRRELEGCTEQGILGERDQHDSKDQTGPIETPAEQQGGGQHGEREDRGETGGRTAQRGHGEQHARANEDERFGDKDRKSTRLNSSHLGISYA